MQPYHRLIYGMLCAIVLTTTSFAQDSTAYGKLYQLPDKFFGRIDDISKKTASKIERQTEKYLARLQRQELKLQKKLSRKDSTLAKDIFGDVNARYSSMQSQSELQGKGRMYVSRLDSMTTLLRFVNQEKGMGITGETSEKIQAALNSYGGLQQQLNKADAIKKYLQQRQQLLQQRLGEIGFVRELKQFKKEVYYYRAQLEEYRTALEDPSKLEATLLRVANTIPAFRNFFNKYSALAGMFRLDNSQAVSGVIQGLQTRASIQQNLQQRFGNSPQVTAAVRQNIQAGQAQLNDIKNKVLQLGGGANGGDMPDFKPNSQQTKRFVDRIEVGMNVQSTRASSFFPVTTDVALSLGFKLNDRSIVGIGSSYKLGWGKNIRHIAFTHEGVGLRSFLDWKLKGSFWISGGAEMNYRSRFNDIDVLRNYSAWQKSALCGISKKYKIGKKAGGSFSVLYDFLSYKQIPRTNPIVFRTGWALH